MTTPFPTPAPRRCSRPARTPHYPLLENRTQSELGQLADPSFAQGLDLVRARVAELLTDDETDWKEAFSGLEVLVRMMRVQHAALDPELDPDVLAALADRIAALAAEYD